MLCARVRDDGAGSGTSAQTARRRPLRLAVGSPSPRPGSFTISVDAHTTFVSQSTNGPGSDAAGRRGIRGRQPALAAHAVRYVLERAARTRECFRVRDRRAPDVSRTRVRRIADVGRGICRRQRHERCVLGRVAVSDAEPASRLARPAVPRRLSDARRRRRRGGVRRVGARWYGVDERRRADAARRLVRPRANRAVRLRATAGDEREPVDRNRDTGDARRRSAVAVGMGDAGAVAAAARRRCRGEARARDDRVHRRRSARAAADAGARAIRFARRRSQRGHEVHRAVRRRGHRRRSDRDDGAVRIEPGARDDAARAASVQHRRRAARAHRRRERIVPCDARARCDRRARPLVVHREPRRRARQRETGNVRARGRLAHGAPCDRVARPLPERRVLRERAAAVRRAGKRLERRVVVAGTVAQVELPAHQRLPREHQSRKAIA